MTTQNDISYRKLLGAANYRDQLEESSSKEEIHSKMAALKNTDPVQFYLVLGLMYDIAVYQNSESCFADQVPEHEQNLYFASTREDDFPGAAATIPLCTTLEESYRVACETLGLELLFQREHEAGHRLPRAVQHPQGTVAA